MILFKKIRWRNLLLTGNVFTEIELNKNKTTLIVGKNGHGKSTLLDALTFVLFKKAFRNVNLPQLINNINGSDLEVEIECSSGSHEYLIRRGLKPTLLEVFVDGIKLTKLPAATKDLQSYIEDHILKVSYESFKQVVLLGNADYTPFMQLDPAKRRVFIDNILGIGVFSSMVKILKLKLEEIKTQSSDINYKLASVTEQINLVKDFILKLETDQKKESEDLQSSIDENIASLKRIEDEILCLRQTITNDKKTISDASDIETSIQKLTELDRQLKAKIKVCKDQIKYYTHTGICNACKQLIDESFKDKTIKEAQASLLILNDHNLKLNTKLEQKNARLKEIGIVNKTIKSIESEIQIKNSNISGIKYVLTKLQASLNKKPENLDDQKLRLNDLNTTLVNLNLERESTVTRRHYYDVVAQMLKENGIKSSVIRQYLPAINKLVNHYLSKFNFFLSFVLDANFDETFRARGMDLMQYNSFSMGERAKIDLSLMFAWRDVAKLKNSCATNLIILDEVFDNSLDEFAADDLNKILHEFDNSQNIIVISHKNDNKMNDFEKVLKFERLKNFSHVFEVDNP